MEIEKITLNKEMELKKKVSRIIVIAIVAGGLGYGCGKVTGGIFAILNAVFLSISSAAVSSIYELIDTHGYGLKLWWKTKFKYANKPIYLSFAYLYKIQIDGKYLLIKGNRLKNQYQPVGGVYKYYPEAKSFLESIKFQPDKTMGNMDDDDDLRISVQGKHIFEFLDWFKQMKDREYDPIREFREELLETGILPKNEFETIKYRKVSVHDIGITYSKYNDCLEYVYAEIFELVPTEKQKEVLKNLCDISNENVCWATNTEIKKLCAGGIEKNLGTNTPWILE